VTRSRRPRRRGRHDDRGALGGIEILPLAVLIFVVGGLLVLNVWAVVDLKMAVSGAAREAARAYAETPAGLDGAAAWERAAAAGQEAFTAHRRAPATATLVPVVDPGGPQRCARIVVEARAAAPSIALPVIGGIGQGLVVRARHSELVDPYRDGLDGDGCA
jgi:hypothetical protein